MSSANSNDVLTLGYKSDCTKEGGGVAGMLAKGIATGAPNGGTGGEIDEDI